MREIKLDPSEFHSSNAHVTYIWAPRPLPKSLVLRTTLNQRLEGRLERFRLGPEAAHALRLGRQLLHPAAQAPFQLPAAALELLQRRPRQRELQLQLAAAPHGALRLLRQARLRAPELQELLAQPLRGHALPRLLPQLLLATAPLTAAVLHELTAELPEVAQLT